MGNDFYREIGDAFSCLIVDNPDITSEMRILQGYAPSVEAWVLERLAKAFADLRQLVDTGLLSYPYSTRELIQVCRHLEQFSGNGQRSGVGEALRNVLDFEKEAGEENGGNMDRVIGIFSKHGISLDPAPTGREGEEEDDPGRYSIGGIRSRKERMSEASEVQMRKVREEEGGGILDTDPKDTSSQVNIKVSSGKMIRKSYDEGLDPWIIE